MHHTDGGSAKIVSRQTNLCSVSLEINEHSLNDRLLPVNKRRSNC